MRAHLGISDLQVLALTLAHDTSAFAELVRRHRGLLYRCITRVTRRYERTLGSECADDVFAETCVLLWQDDLRRLRAYDAARGMKLSSWLGLIAGHAAWDHVRRALRRPHHDALEVVDHRPSVEGPPSALDALLAHEQRSELHTLTAVLSERDRDFVARYFEEDREPEEVAALLGVSVKTVYSKKHKITTRLREHAALAA